MDEQLEPEAIDWADGTEYVFEGPHSMEIRIVGRLDRGETAAEIREELLASGQSPAVVDEAFDKAETFREAQAKEDHRAQRSKRMLQVAIWIAMGSAAGGVLVNVLGR